jgi:phosphinothricin acetyltransferase
MDGAVSIRLATVDDAEAIRSIYNVEVTQSTVTFDLEPRSLAAQRDWLAARSGAHSAIVAVLDGEVIGFASLSPWKDRPAYRTSVEDSVYIHRAHQGRGVGRLLLTRLVEVADESGFHAMFGRIVGGHEASIGLHRALGFEVIGVEKEVGRKFGRWLDVVVVEKLLP